MARDEVCPIEVGSYEADGGSQYDYLLGKVFVFEDVDYSTTGAKSFRSGRYVKRMLVRNNSGFTLLPKRLVMLQKSAGSYLGKVAGYARLTADGPCFPVDEFLPAAGVPDGALFFIVVEGPAMVQTDLAASAANFYSVGDVLVSLTAATSGATTAGRVSVQDLTGATAVLGAQLQNAIGRALSARTTAQTNTDTLMCVGTAY